MAKGRVKLGPVRSVDYHLAWPYEGATLTYYTTNHHHIGVRLRGAITVRCQHGISHDEVPLWQPRAWCLTCDAGLSHTQALVEYEKQTRAAEAQRQETVTWLVTEFIEDRFADPCDG